MSSQYNQYAGFGYFVDGKEAIKQLESKYTEEEIEDMFDKYHDSAFKTSTVEVDGCSMIRDNMSDKYLFFGKIFQKSDNYYPLHKVLPVKLSKKDREHIKTQFEKIFGTEFKAEQTHVVFTHYR